MASNNLYNKKKKSEKENSTQGFRAGDRVVSYFRDSGGDGQDRSVEEQTNEFMMECNRQKLIPFKVFKEPIRSGTTLRGRRQFKEMLQYFDSGQARSDGVRGLLIYAYSRFARDEDDAPYFIASLRRQGYVVRSITDNIPEGEFSRVFEALTHFKDAQYSRDLAKNIQRGQRLILNNYHPEGNGGLYELPSGELVQLTGGGFPPLGYVRHQVLTGQNRRGTPRYNGYWQKTGDTDLAARVRRAWELGLEGKSYSEIERVCKLGMQLASYNSFFKTVTYTGTYVYGDFVRENAFEGYVTFDEFERMQEIIHDRAGGLRRVPKPAITKYLLSGFLRCGHCGDPLHGGKLSPARKPTHYYYECASRAKKRPCPATTKIRMELLEGLILQKIYEQMDPLKMDVLLEEMARRNEKKRLRVLPVAFNYDEVLEQETVKIKNLTLQLATGEAQELGIEIEVRDLLKEAATRRLAAQQAQDRQKEKTGDRYKKDYVANQRLIELNRDLLRRVIANGKPSGEYLAGSGNGGGDIAAVRNLLESLELKVTLYLNEKDGGGDDEGEEGGKKSKKGEGERKEEKAASGKILGNASVAFQLGVMLCATLGAPVEETQKNSSPKLESYVPKEVRLKGLEPLTFWSATKRSIQLSYRRKIFLTWSSITILTSNVKQNLGFCRAILNRSGTKN